MLNFKKSIILLVLSASLAACTTPTTTSTPTDVQNMSCSELASQIQLKKTELVNLTHQSSGMASMREEMYTHSLRESLLSKRASLQSQRASLQSKRESLQSDLSRLENTYYAKKCA